LSVRQSQTNNRGAITMFIVACIVAIVVAFAAVQCLGTQGYCH